MLLHYLQNVSEADMGITKDEADKMFSSIYEARISLSGYAESKKATQNWNSYGLNKFYAVVRGANNRLRRSQHQFDTILKRYNFGFVEVTEKGEQVVKNLLGNQHMFSGKMATAYNYAKPQKVQRFRSLLNLGQVGLGFLPIPNWLKSQVDGFINSFYVEQKKVEGSLIGYFDINGNTVMSKNIMKQLANPYLK